MLAISIVLLLIFVVFQNKPANQLNCYANDISLCKNEIVYSFYEVSDNRAEIYFEVDKENIIEINDVYVKGLQAGEVKVTIKASYNDEVCVDEFVVKVYAETFNIKFKPISNCSFYDNTLHATANTFQFSFEVYDALNREVENLPFEILTDSEVSIVKNFYTIMVTSNKNCDLHIKFNEISFDVHLTAILYSSV